MNTNRVSFMVHTLKNTIGLTALSVVVAAVFYMYGQPAPVRAASVTCERQTIHTGPNPGDTADLVYDLNSPHFTAMSARDLTSPIGSQNNTDVDMYRSMSLGGYSSGGNLSSDSRSTNGTFMTMGMLYEAQEDGFPNSTATGVHEFTTPVRGLSFTITDLDHLTNHDESFNIKVFKNDGSQITDFTPYDTIHDSTSSQPTLTAYSAPNTYSTLGTIYDENNSVDFAFPSDMEIKRVEIRYYWTAVPSAPVVDGNNVGGAIGYKNVSFDGPCIGLATNATPIGDTVQLDYTVKNIGGLPLAAVALPVNLDAIFGAGNYSVVSAPSIISGESTIDPNGGFTGAGANDLIMASSSLAVGKSSTVRLVVKVKNPAVGGDGKGNYSSTEEVSGRPLATTAFRVSDDSVSGTETDANGNGDAADDASPWTATVSSVGDVPGIPSAGDETEVSTMQIAGFSSVALAPLAYLNRARLLARFKR